MNIWLVIAVIIGGLMVGTIAVFGLITSQKIFFLAFPRLAAFGDPNKIRFIHLNGFLFVISNDIWCRDVVFQSEVSNMMFQYNLKPTMYPTEIMSSKKNLNIEMLDVSTNKQMSYTVPHSAKPLAIRFFKKYRELMNRINQHKINNK
ncbi:hypothetical protein IJ843_00790 [bacterium]|nr:hypothetical protein [bacterium]